MSKPRGILIDSTLSVWVHTEELWRSLEAAADLSKYELGRFKPWAALSPKVLNKHSYDLNAMIGWARQHGVPHTVERAMHYSGTTGTVNLATETLMITTTTTPKLIE